MKLFTEIELSKSNIKLDISSRMMMLGSCFAENVGEKIQQRMPAGSVDVNPFGVLYNPLSIARVLNLLIMDVSSAEPHLYDSIFYGREGLWHSWLHTTHFSGNMKEECFSKVMNRYKTAHEHLRSTDVLCITFGTTICYLHDGLVVTNCHKELQSCFDVYEPSLNELKEVWKNLINRLQALNKKLIVCLTVSPFRYRKYGFHESQLQKAKLLLLSDTLCAMDNVCYFPSYEIMMDELRDYRFYAADMLHPSAQAVDIITERFMDWTFTDELRMESIKLLKEYQNGIHRSII